MGCCKRFYDAPRRFTISSLEDQFHEIFYFWFFMNHLAPVPPDYFGSANQLEAPERTGAVA
jgi:hypothetical protein